MGVVERHLKMDQQTKTFLTSFRYSNSIDFYGKSIKFLESRFNRTLTNPCVALLASTNFTDDI